MVAGNKGSNFFKGFKGLHTGPEIMLDPDQLTRCNNWYPTNERTLKKREGLNVKDSSLVAGTGVSILGALDTTIMMTNSSGNNLYRRNLASGDVTADTVNGVQWGYPYDDKFYYGTASGIKYIDTSNSISTVAAGVTNTHHGTVHKERLWVTENESNGKPYRLKYSAPNDFTDFVTAGVAGSIDVISEDRSDYIISLHHFFDVLYILKARSIWALYANGDPVNWSLREVRRDIGASIPRSVTTVENAFYFMGKLGRSYSGHKLYKTDGTTFVDVSEPISELLDYAYNNTLTSFGSGSFGLTFYRDLLVIPIASTLADTANTVYVYNTKTGHWGKWIFSNPETVLGTVVANGDLYLVGDDAGSGKLYLLSGENEDPSYLDDTVAYVAEITTPWIYPNIWFEMPRFMNSFFLCSNQAWDVGVSSDGTTRTIAPTSSGEILKLANIDYAKRFKVTLDDNGAQSASTLYGFGYEDFGGERISRAGLSS